MAWKFGECFSKGTIEAIAQTPDGYLGLGSEFGLFRFDGVRAVPRQPRGGEHLPSSLIRTLLVSRDGILWFTTRAGHCVSAAADGRPGSSRKEAEIGS